MFQHHSQKIEDMNQPLLISRPKKKDARRGQGDILLVPELCNLTNAPQKWLAQNFKRKQDIHGVTRLEPHARYETLRDFRHRISK